MIDMTNHEDRMIQIIRNIRTCDPNDLYEFIGRNHTYYKTSELANVIKELLYAIKMCDCIGGTDLENLMYDTAEGIGDIYDIYDV